MLSFGAIWMNPEDMVLNEVRQTQDKCHRFSLNCRSYKNQSLEAQSRTVGPGG
jgi:hypothetical protein